MLSYCIAFLFKFLEEARKNTVQIEPDVITEDKKQLNWEKKKRKSWKSSLFSWLKNDKKSESLKQQSNTTTLASKARRAHVSGPVMVGVAAGSVQRAASGPLTGLFGSTGSSEEPEFPYMCLSQLNKQRVHSYGPVYLVT